MQGMSFSFGTHQKARSFTGRMGQKLNLAGLPSLRSQDLAALLPVGSDHQSSSLTTLVLNNTGIDDDSVPFISSCPDLQSLEVAGTKLTSTSWKWMTVHYLFYQSRACSY
jgi:hypothetical protein